MKVWRLCVYLCVCVPILFWPVVFFPSPASHSPLYLCETADAQLFPVWLAAIGSPGKKISLMQRFLGSSRGSLRIGGCVSEGSKDHQGTCSKLQRQGWLFGLLSPGQGTFPGDYPVRTRMKRACVGSWVSGDQLSLSGSSNHKPMALSQHANVQIQAMDTAMEIGQQKDGYTIENLWWIEGTTRDFMWTTISPLLCATQTVTLLKTTNIFGKIIPSTGCKPYCLVMSSLGGVGGWKKKCMWDPEQRLVPCFFNFLPRSSCAEIEPESVIGVIILSHHVGEWQQNKLNCDYLCPNWEPAAPMDQLIAAAVYEIHTGLWQLAL